jgi:RNA polymerase sigma-70 factor (sigma-E family)
MGVESRSVLSGEGLAALYVENYGRLVRVAALLLGDVGSAEEVVQEAFVRVLGTKRDLREPDRAVAYVTRAVVNLARSRIRRRLVFARLPVKPTVWAGGADQRVVEAVEQAAIVRALRRLPARQRQAVVLRYYAQFTETEAAAAMAVSLGAVRSYTARGASRLRDELKEMR